MSYRKRYALTSRCIACDHPSTVHWLPGTVEQHRCKKCGTSWDKSLASSRSAMAGARVIRYNEQSK